MKTLTKVWDFIRDMLGFRRNSKYVKNYLNDANIKSSIYMAFIVIVLELWMIFRNVHEYVIPKWDNHPGFTSHFDLIYAHIGLYVLFILCSSAILVFSITYKAKRETKGAFYSKLVLGALCVLWPILLVFEHLSFSGSKAIVSSTTVLVVYLTMPLLGASIILHTLFNKKNEDLKTILSMSVIICFALVCLAFGIKVGYSDFANPFIKNDAPNFDRLKMITCFFTMIIFVACLLIWKPYISILMLTSIFVGFMYMLKGYGDRKFLEADEINYITFLISLTMVAISIYQQRIAEAKKDEQLIHDSMYDKLIDVHNLNYLSDKINTALANDKTYLDNKIYLFINLMNFKIFNVQKGFEAGDEFLNSLAKHIQDVFGRKNTARLSDDHFVVFADADSLNEKIDELDKLVKESADGLFVNIKVGGYRPRENDTTRRCIDKARYASNLIKTKYEVNYLEYDDEIDKRFNKRQYVVNHLEEAIQKGWIKAYYQPVVWSKNVELCGAEALARWEDPTYGFMAPNEFVPVLEETRMVHKLDAHIVEYVCKKMRETIDLGKPVVPVSVNFSRIDFELMDVIEVLEKNINKYNIDKRYIHVEITESALSDDTDTLNEIIAKLQNMGYAIWLDDFGSGYSSLNVLKDFAFDVIKIDMKFLTNFSSNEKTKDILDCIIQLADRLGMRTLTEGVETKEEAKFLESIGCGRLQGYLFGKPYKIEVFEEKIASGELKVSKKLL